MGTYISIDRIPQITCSHVFNICALCTWTHVLTYDIISLYSGEGASIICRPTGTYKRKRVHLMSDEKKVHTLVTRKPGKKPMKNIWKNPLRISESEFPKAIKQKFRNTPPLWGKAWTLSLSGLLMKLWNVTIKSRYDRPHAPAYQVTEMSMCSYCIFPIITTQWDYTVRPIFVPTTILLWVAAGQPLHSSFKKNETHWQPKGCDRRHSEAL